MQVFIPDYEVVMKIIARVYFKLLTISLAALPFAVFAQDNDPIEIVITTPRHPEISTPLNASNINAASLAMFLPATSDTASLVGDIPGVSLYGAGGVSSLPAIHGMADDRVNTQLDGQSLISSCPNHMNSPLSHMDPTHVRRIKVFAGIVPVSVGGDSIGGTIQVTSAPPEFAAPGQGTLVKGQAGSFYRSNGKAYGANVAATIAGEELNMTYSGSTAQSGDYKAANNFKPAAVSGNRFLSGDEVGSSGYKSMNQDLGFALRHDNHLLEMNVGMQYIPYEGYPNQRMDMTGNKGVQANLHYSGRYEWGTLESRIYQQTTNHSMNFGNDKQFWYGAPATIPGMPMNTEGRTTGALIKADIVLTERDILRAGVEVQNYKLNDWWPPSGGTLMAPNTFWNINNGHRDRVDVFGEWEARWSPQWLSQVGIRSDTVKMNTGVVQGYNSGMMYLPDAAAFNALDHRHKDQNWDLTALSRYTPDAMESFEAGYSRKTRSPNLYELYTWSAMPMTMEMNNFSGDGNGYVGNLGLKPEVAHTLGATADWHDAAGEQWEVKFTPYYTYVQNYIDAQRCGTAACGGAANLVATTSFVNLQYVNQSARFYGMDLSGYMPIGEISGYGRFTAKGLLSYTRGRNLTTGNNLYNIMPLNAKLSLEQRLGNWTNTAEIKLVSAKTHVSQVRNEVQTAGYSLFNLHSSYEQKKFRLDIGIDNLFNRFYSQPLGGAYVGQGATMMQTGMGAPAWGVPVPGMGRSVYAGINVKL